LPLASGFGAFTIAAPQATSIAEALAVSEITRVNGLTGVFCASALVHDRLVLVHLVVSCGQVQPNPALQRTAFGGR
jgi:hypothetical protein